MTSNNNPAAPAPTIPPTLRHLTPLTKNELLLLSTYDQIKQYEKISAKLKATEAKRRLEEADERYRAKVRERERLENGGDDDEEKNTNKERAEEQYYESSDDSEDEQTKQQRLQKQQQRQLEITQLREEIEAKSQKEAERDAAKKREEEMRRELLGPEEKKKKRPREEEVDGAATAEKEEHNMNDVTNNNDFMQEQDDTEQHKDTADTTFMTSSQPSIISGPSIKKKRIEMSTTTTPSTSLIANISGGATPIHDFSTKLKMSKTSLDGSILFPLTIGEKPWRPPNNPVDFMDGCFELDLPDFDPNNLSSSTNNNNNNNTVAIKFHAPQESSRFSINIASPNHNGYDSILFHFNPRQFQRGGQLVINNKKESMWGNDLSVPLSTLPLVFGKSACTLIVQVNEEGFDVFVEGVHCARLEHRMALPKLKGPLRLQFPASDDYGNPEDWEVYRVWWGHKDSMADKDLSGVAGVNVYSSVHPKKLFVSGLPKIHSDPEVDLRRAEMERAFRKYGGPNGAVLVSVQKDSTFAFVEVASEQQADLALVEMAGRYRVNKARRTKHEALMEERAAKEAAEKGNVKESVDWD